MLKTAVMLCLLTASTEAGAASFFCDSTTAASCVVDTANSSSCESTFTPKLFARCQGRNTGSGNQLACFFAITGSQINTGSSDLIDQPGVLAVAIEWINPFPIAPAPVAPIVLSYKDGRDSYSVSCSPQN
jgi:hypothetical protein